MRFHLLTQNWWFNYWCKTRTLGVWQSSWTTSVNSLLPC